AEMTAHPHGPLRIVVLWPHGIASSQACRTCFGREGIMMSDSRELGEGSRRAYPGERQGELVALRVLLVPALLASGDFGQHAVRRQRRAAVPVCGTDGIPMVGDKRNVARRLHIIAKGVEKIEAHVDVDEHVRVR